MTKATIIDLEYEKSTALVVSIFRTRKVQGRRRITKDSSKKIDGLLKRKGKKKEWREREMGASYPPTDLMAALKMMKVVIGRNPVSHSSL